MELSKGVGVTVVLLHPFALHMSWNSVLRSALFLFPLSQTLPVTCLSTEGYAGHLSGQTPIPHLGAWGTSGPGRRCVWSPVTLSMAVLHQGQAPSNCTWLTCSPHSTQPLLILQ